MADETVTDQELITGVIEDDSPPDPQADDNKHPLPHSTDEQDQESSVPASTTQPEPVLVRGRGRPRADGLPNKTASLTTPSTPTPQYKRFGSGENRPAQKPIYAIRWFEQLPTWAKERMVVYVYRKWPVLLDPPLDSKGEKTDYKYIDKLPAPLSTLPALQDRYGAGDYQYVINDDVVDRRTIVEINVEENFRDLVNHPPTDRRIDNVENVDLNDPANKSYVQYLRGKGKLPEQQLAKGREADMAEATAVKEMASTLSRVLDKALDSRDRGNNDTTSIVVSKLADSFSESQKMATGMMKDALSTIEEARSRQQPQTPPVDPIDTLDKVLSVMDKIRPAQSGDSEVIKLLLAQMNKQQERFEEVMKGIKEGPASVAASTAPPDPLNTTKQTLEAVMAIATTMGLKAPGATAALMSAETGSWWKDNLPEIMQYGSQAIGAIANAFTTKMQIDARQAAMTSGMQPNQPQQPSNLYVMPPPAQSAAPPLQPSNLDGQQTDPAATAADPALAPPTPEQQQELDRFYALMSAMHRPLMNHINKALGGDRFAEWLIDSREDGDAVYLQIKQAGAENMVAALRMYEPLWKDLESKQDLLPGFIDEFINMEEIRAQEEANQDEDDEAEEAEAEAVN